MRNHKVTLFYLIRHAESTANTKGILAGRSSDVQLSKNGLNQASQIPEILSEIRFDSIMSSPLERCISTARFLSQSKSLKVITEEALIEQDYGDWTGKKLSSLRKLKAWNEVQTSPENFHFPSGESFQNVYDRVHSLLNKLHKKKSNSEKVHAIVTHADIIKMIVSSTLAGPFSSFQNVVINPASISIIRYQQDKRFLIAQNIHSLQNIKISDLATVGGSRGSKN
jgi:probable phosphoglycerate mutase